MKKIILAAIFYCTSLSVFSQKIDGQWHGSFNSAGDIVMYGAGDTEYVLELEINGTKVGGFSYSYFQGRKYYVICRLDGTYFPATKKIKVIEVERVKGYTPPDFSDCFQIHYLTYEKIGNTEQLEGKWITKPGQPGTGCGDGSTLLTRRTLNKSLSQFNKKNAQQPLAKKTVPAPKNPIAATTKPAKPVNPPAKAPVTVKTEQKKKPVVKPVEKTAPQTSEAVVKINPSVKTPDKIIQPEIKKAEIPEIKADMSFEKRKSDVLKTIELENETFRVDLYDNGEVDGDSISLFYNNKLILSHKKLSTKPITLNLAATDDDMVNELTMYAENLGEIPPNTALMVVTDGEKRYEVRIASDLKNSGTIRFVHKLKSPQ